MRSRRFVEVPVLRSYEETSRVPCEFEKPHSLMQANPAAGDQAACGRSLSDVVLFGSRARGDARPDSDYDIAVFLRDMSDQPAEMNRREPNSSLV